MHECLTHCAPRPVMRMLKAVTFSVALATTWIVQAPSRRSIVPKLPVALASQFGDPADARTMNEASVVAPPKTRATKTSKAKGRQKAPMLGLRIVIILITICSTSSVPVVLVKLSAVSAVTSGGVTGRYLLTPVTRRSLRSFQLPATKSPTNLSSERRC